MWMQFLIPLLQLGLKLVPVLYQWKLIRSEADMKELQRRFEVAIRKAEEGALDSVKLREQHEVNKKELKDKRTKVGW